MYRIVISPNYLTICLNSVAEIKPVFVLSKILKASINSSSGSTSLIFLA